MKEEKIMKRIDAIISYNFRFNPEDVGLKNDCSEEEFRTIIERYLIRIYGEIEPILGAPDEIKMEVLDI